VVRQRLFEALDGSGDARLIVVRAPAGYGKSTLVAQWLAQVGAPVAWASLDAGDDDPWSFFSLIAAAIDTIARGLVDGTRSLLDAGETLSEQAIVRSLVAELSTTTRPFVLVLDDFHVITSPEIQRCVTFLLNHLPPPMRVVVVTRIEPPLALARLRASGEVVELGQGDLLFSQEEALALYHGTLNVDLTPDEVEALLVRSEGWVTALQLIGISMRGKPRDRLRRFAVDSSGNVRFVDEYLWEVILQPLPEELRMFLLRTSILDRFNADLCTVVARVANAAELIHRCDQANLFVMPLDDRGEWYRYHHLFADALRGRLAQVVSEDEVRSLHLHAADWLEGQDLIEEAAHHAAAGRDWDRTGRLLERVGVALFDSDRVTQLRSWLELLPPEAIEGRPRLAFWLAWVLARSGDFPRSWPFLRRALDAWAEVGDQKDRGLIRILDAYGRVVTGDFLGMAAEAKTALDLLPAERRGDRAVAHLVLGVAHFFRGAPDDADRAFANTRIALDDMAPSWIHLAEMTNSGGVLIQRGRLPEAAVLFRRVVRAGNHRYHLQVQGALFQLAGIYFEWDRLDDAERCLRQADDLSESMRTIGFSNRVHLELARLAWSRGKVEDAFDAVERAAEFDRQTGVVQHARDTRAQQALFWLASNQVALARRWAASSGLDPLRPPEYERLLEHLTYVRLQILENRPDLALRVLDAVQELAASDGRAGDIVGAEVLRALAFHASGEHALALEALERAIDLGTPGGYVRVYVGEGEVIAPLLRHLAARGTHRDSAQRLLAAFDGGSVAPRPSQAGVVDALTERELEVLWLVAAGLPNREIGQRLFISEKTVKKHVSNVLAKLETANRTQAVDQARRLGLL
jgi:LuxR family maltose regulon positive regulatory protein